MLIALGAVVLGFTLLVVGGDLLVRGAAKIAEKLHLTPVVIGLTVVAFGTSVPELVVSLLAAFDSNPDIAAGNVIGSNILNIAAVLGFTAIILPITVTRDVTRYHWPFMFALSLIVVGMLWDTHLGRLEGAFLFGSLVAFTAWMIRRTRTQEKEFKATQQLSQQELARAAQGSPWRHLLFISMGIVLLWLGGKIALWGAIDLSRLWGLTERVIALTVVAVGTSLPELVASMVAAFRKQEDMAVGNIIGSNIYNIGCVLGLTSLIQPIQVTRELLETDAMMMLGVAFIFFPLALFLKGIPRWAGVGYVLSLTFYMIWLLLPGAFG